MKTKLTRLLAAALLIATTGTVLAQTPAGTAFTYQGQLQNNNAPASGTYNVTFTLFNTNTTGVAIAGPVTNSVVVVTNGLFTTMIDFGGTGNIAAFIDPSNFLYLEIAVESNGASSFTTLTPRQQLTPAPQSIYSMNAGVASVANAVSATAIVRGQSLMVGANDGTLGVFATITGGSNNTASATAAVVAGGSVNTASGDHSTVSGGEENTASGNHAFVGGGVQSTASGDYSAVVGGMNNIIQTNATFSFIGGGDNNSIQSGTTESTIGGGSSNFIDTNSPNSTIGGGSNNVASGDHSTVGGGANNNAGGHQGGERSQSGNEHQRGGTVGGGDNNTAGGHTGGERSQSGNEHQRNQTVGGGENNTASGDHATVGGGEQNMAIGDHTFVGGGLAGSAISDFAIVAGGMTNTIQTNADFSFVGGGENNSIQSGATESTISGGSSNSIGTNASDSTISGGKNNSIQSGAMESTIGGGSGNSIGISASETTIGGGYANTATGQYAVVPGGANNAAQGTYSFAAGQQAQALYQGNFVWADSQNANFASTANDQFLIRAQGFVGINTNDPLAPLHVVGARTGNSSRPIAMIENLDGSPSSSSALRVIARGSPTDGALSVSTAGPVSGGTNASSVLIARFGNANTYVSQLDNNGNWTATAFYPSSDRSAKENFQPVSPREVLDRVNALPISRWNYKVDKSSEHIGPMAQDFWAAFKVGMDDKHIATVDEDGVALAAIQGLNQKLQEELSRRDAENAKLKQQNDLLAERLSELEATVKQLAAQK